MWATALVYYGGALLVFCLCGWLGEKYLFRDDREE